MANRRRVSALILCVGLVLILAVSTVFIAHEADHDCCGEDCPICRAIAVNIRMLRTLGLALLALLSIFFLQHRQAVHYRQDRNNGIFSGTLVSWKVRLDD